MVTKVTAARSIYGAFLLLQYRKEMQENYRKGDWAEATKDTAFFAVKVAPVVAPNLVFGALAPYWIGAAVGVGVTIAIVEITGLGTTEDVLDLVLDPWNAPKKYVEVVGPALKEKVTEPIIEYVTEELWQKQLVEPIGGWLSRRERDVRRAWEITRPQRPSWL